MSDSPYTPPAAHVEDHRVDIGPPPRPVKVAVVLLWITFVLSLPIMVLQEQRMSAAPFHWFAIAFSFVVLGIVATFFVYIRRGANWARIGYLLLVLLSLYLSTRVPDPLGPTVLEQALNVLSWTLTTVAMGLLFFPRPARDWFRSARRQG